MSFEYNIKLIVLGEGFVGKGKLLHRYFKKNFTEKKYRESRILRKNREL